MLQRINKQNSIRRLEHLEQELERIGWKIQLGDKWDVFWQFVLWLLVSGDSFANDLDSLSLRDNQRSLKLLMICSE